MQNRQHIVLLTSYSTYGL